MSIHTPKAAAKGTWTFGPLASDEVVAVGAYDTDYSVDIHDVVLGGGTCKIYGSPTTTGAVWVALATIAADAATLVTTPWQRLKVTLTGAAAATIYVVVRNG